MRLALILNSFRREFVGPIPKHKGNVLIGKKRFVPPVTLGNKIQLFRELKHEERTMKYLSVPFISQNQENLYLESVGRNHQEFWDEFLLRPIEEPLEQSYAADYLEKLNLSRSFQEED